MYLSLSGRSHPGVPGLASSHPAYPLTVLTTGERKKEGNKKNQGPRDKAKGKTEKERKKKPIIHKGKGTPLPRQWLPLHPLLLRPPHSPRLPCILLHTVPVTLRHCSAVSTISLLSSPLLLLLQSTSSSSFPPPLNLPSNHASLPSPLLSGRSHPSFLPTSTS